MVSLSHTHTHTHTQNGEQMRASRRVSPSETQIWHKTPKTQAKSRFWDFGGMNGGMNGGAWTDNARTSERCIESRPTQDPTEHI
jgi:hypothetical protein